MKAVSLEELLEAGCHFGHQVTRSNPKARDFIFEARDNIHIIDLAKTKEGLEEAAAFVKNLASKNGNLLIVGTKRQARGVIEEEIKRADDVFYVTNRWVGGLLTNFSEVSKNFERLKTLTENLNSKEAQAGYTKKEIGDWAKEKKKLEGMYGGVIKLKGKPDAMFIIDSHFEHLAAKEAARQNVPTVAIVDTNADPALVDYAIPANDDAVGSIKFILSYIIDAWNEGKKNLKSKVQNSESVKSEESKKKENGSGKKEDNVKKSAQSPKPKPVKNKENSKKSKTKTSS